MRRFSQTMRFPVAFTFKVACHILRQKRQVIQRFATAFQPKLLNIFRLRYAGRVIPAYPMIDFEALSHYSMPNGLLTGYKGIQVNGRTG
jgi:hypothetical protein